MEDPSHPDTLGSQRHCTPSLPVLSRGPTHQCLVSWSTPGLMGASSKPHSSLSQSQGFAHPSWLCPPHLQAAHQENAQFLCLSNPNPNIPLAKLVVLIDFSRSLAFHLTHEKEAISGEDIGNFTEIQSPLSRELQS